jgi:glycosyltransferase involved in cell wall biosynthesis
MKIGIIANSLDNALTGIGNYTYNVLKHMPYRTENKITIIHSVNDKTYLSKLLTFNNLKDIKTPRLNMLPLAKGIQKMILMPLKINQQKLDVVHDTYHFGPFFLLNRPTRRVLTVHDLTPLILPEFHKRSRTFLHKVIFYKILKDSDHIITVSENTKNDLINKFKIPEDKIRVIPLAANENFKQIDESKIFSTTTKYNINCPFILYVGTLEPRKNIPNLLNAYYKLKKQGINHKLVIAGGKGWKYKEIFETIEKLNLQKDVIFTGYVPDEDLPGLYNAAELFVYPSLYEGFGLPPLEAMQCGTPVITSNTSSLPEVVGAAGITVNPYDVDELANKMYEVLTNEDLRKEMSKKGLERAKLFSWKKCAEEHLKVYEEVYNMK